MWNFCCLACHSYVSHARENGIKPRPTKDLWKINFSCLNISIPQRCNGDDQSIRYLKLTFTSPRVCRQRKSRSKPGKCSRAEVRPGIFCSAEPTTVLMHAVIGIQASCGDFNSQFLTRYDLTVWREREESPATFGVKKERKISAIFLRNFLMPVKRFSGNKEREKGLQICENPGHSDCCSNKSRKTSNCHPYLEANLHFSPFFCPMRPRNSRFYSCSRHNRTK